MGVGAKFFRSGMGKHRLPEGAETGRKIRAVKRLSSFGIQFKAFAHEGKEIIPTGKLNVAQQGFNMLEEFSAGA